MQTDDNDILGCLLILSMAPSMNTLTSSINYGIDEEEDQGIQIRRWSKVPFQKLQWFLQGGRDQ